MANEHPSDDAPQTGSLSPQNGTKMKEEVVILVVEDDDGHARLIDKNLRRAGIRNELLRFQDGQQILDFLFRRGEGRKREDYAPYLLLLDIRIPKIDGVEVLRQIKQEDELRKIPVIMLTTMDDPRQVDACGLQLLHRQACRVRQVHENSGTVGTVPQDRTGAADQWCGVGNRIG